MKLTESLKKKTTKAKKTPVSRKGRGWEEERELQGRKGGNRSEYIIHLYNAMEVS